MTDDILTKEAAAKLLDCKPTTFEDMARAGQAAFVARGLSHDHPLHLDDCCNGWRIPQSCAAAL